MANKVYKIINPAACTNCGACEDICPCEAVYEKDGKRWINSEKCADCGACKADCPVEEAIFDSYR